MSNTPGKVVSGAVAQTEYVIPFHGVYFPCEYDALGQTFTIYTAHANQSRILNLALNEHKIYSFSVHTDPPASGFVFTNPEEITTLTRLMEKRAAGKQSDVSL